MNNENIKTLMREMVKVCGSIANDLPLATEYFTTENAGDKNNFNVETKQAVKHIKKAQTNIINALKIANDTQELIEEETTEETNVPVVTESGIITGPSLIGG